MLLDVSILKRNPNYRMLWMGQSVSFFGSMVSYVAIPYQIFHLTKSSFWVGALGAVQLIPLLFFALIGGAAADKHDRKKLLLWSEILMALCIFVLMINGLFKHPSVVLIFAVSAILSAINGYHRPSLEAMTPRLVSKQELPSIASLNSFARNFGAILGPSVGGVLIASVGLSATYLVDVLSFLFSLACLSLLKAPPSPQRSAGAEQSTLQNLQEGISYARKRPELIGTYLVDIVAMVFAMPMALFPAMAEGFGKSAFLGTLYAAMSIGGLVVTLFSGWTRKVKRHGAAVILAAAVWGVAIALLGFTKSPWLSVLFLACAGGADMISGIFRSVIWNETIPDALRGRLAGIEMISYMSGPLLGNLRAGSMASVTSVSFSIFSGGVLCVIGVLLCIPLLPRFWKYKPS